MHKISSKGSGRRRHKRNLVWFINPDAAGGQTTTSPTRHSNNRPTDRGGLTEGCQREREKEREKERERELNREKERECGEKERERPT
jgi:hypothetical protein